MTITQVFPYAVGLLDLGAAVIYIREKQWNLAVTWFCYAIAAVSLGQVRGQ